MDPASTTETFVALALNIDNWRWAGVPFYLRTGKRLPTRSTEIVIRFRRPPFVLFRKTSVEKIAPNELVINIQPNEGISLSFEAKVPGPIVRQMCIRDSLNEHLAVSQITEPRESNGKNAENRPRR